MTQTSTDDCDQFSYLNHCYLTFDKFKQTGHNVDWLRRHHRIAYYFVDSHNCSCFMWFTIPNKVYLLTYPGDVFYSYLHKSTTVCVHIVSWCMFQYVLKAGVPSVTVCNGRCEELGCEETCKCYIAFILWHHRISPHYSVLESFVKYKDFFVV